MVAHRVQMTVMLSRLARMAGNAALLAAFPVEPQLQQRVSFRSSQRVIDRLMAEVSIVEFGVMAALAH